MQNMLPLLRREEMVGEARPLLLEPVIDAEQVLDIGLSRFVGLSGVGASDQGFGVLNGWHERMGGWIG